MKKATDCGLAAIVLLMLFSLHNAMLTLWCTLGTLAVFAGVYALVYRATAGVYYKLVRW